MERGFAHCLETGGMRRVFLRGHENILKRLLIHTGGLNLSLIMRKLLGRGTPRGLAGLLELWVRALLAATFALRRPVSFAPYPALPAEAGSTTGC